MRNVHKGTGGIDVANDCGNNMTMMIKMLSGTFDCCPDVTKCILLGKVRIRLAFTKTC